MKRLLFLLTLFVVLGMQAQQHVMTVDVSKPTARINPAMYGIFFEDINFGADGGLYAELVKNRSFEFPQPLVGWIPFGEVTVQDERACFDRNPHYVRITNDGCLLRAGLDNEGYRGIERRKRRRLPFLRLCPYAGYQTNEAFRRTGEFQRRESPEEGTGSERQ